MQYLNPFPSTTAVLVSRLLGLHGWRPGRLARNTALATFWQGVRIALQIAYLVLVARILGAEGYGVFSGSVALAASLSPLVGLGFGLILVKAVSRAPAAFPEHWGRALITLAVTAPVLAAAMLLLAPYLLPVQGRWAVIVLIAAAELVAMPFVTTCSLIFQAHEQLGRTIFNHVQLNVARLAVVAGLAIAGRGSLLEFAWGYFGATALAAVVSFWQVCRAFGRPVWRPGGIVSEAWEGLAFSLSVVANSAHGELDKTLLLRLDTAAATGNYSLATRVVSAATTPLIAYVLAAVPRLFREGEQGVAAAAGLARQLLPPILLYGVLATAGIILCAPVLPWVFGTDFSAALPLVGWLAPLPLLVGTSQLGLNVLSSSGRQRTRVLIEGAGLVANVALNVALIPAWGAQGAVAAMLASQTLLVLLPVATVVRLTRFARIQEDAGNVEISCNVRKRPGVKGE